MMSRLLSRRRGQSHSINNLVQSSANNGCNSNFHMREVNSDTNSNNQDAPVIDHGVFNFPDFKYQIMTACEKNKNFLKFMTMLLITCMHPYLLLFPICYYLIRHLTPDPKYILLLVAFFSILITNGILGTIYIILVMILLIMIWNYDNISFILDLFTPAVESKMQSIKMLALLYINSIMQMPLISIMSNKLYSCLWYLNNDSSNKLGKMINVCEICCDKLILLLDYIVNTFVTSVAVIITTSLEQQLFGKEQIRSSETVSQPQIRRQFRATTSVRDYQESNNNNNNLDDEPMTFDEVMRLKESQNKSMNNIPNLNILNNDNINEILKSRNQSSLLSAIDNEFAILGEFQNELN